MKIAVVGGNGFIGSEFVSYAAKNGHETAVIGSELNVFSDIEAEKASSILKTCDAMVFLAARRLTSAFSVQDYIYNIELAERYLRLAYTCNIRNVIMTSSINVYSNTELPWREDEFHAPLSLYGASKLAVDSIALMYNRQYEMNIKSLRLAQVIGMGERKGYLLNTLIDNAIAGRKQSIYGRGTGRRQYIYVKDVCDAILHCAVCAGDVSGVFNIGIKDSVSILELARIINSIFNNSNGLEMLEDKPEDTREYLMDVSKSERILHWKPHYNLSDTFTDIRDNRGKK